MDPVINLIVLGAFILRTFLKLKKRYEHILKRKLIPFENLTRKRSGEKNCNRWWCLKKSLKVNLFHEKFQDSFRIFWHLVHKKRKKKNKFCLWTTKEFSKENLGKIKISLLSQNILFHNIVLKNLEKFEKKIRMKRISFCCHTPLKISWIEE